VQGKDMPRRTVPLVAGECYHLFNRGVNREKIFFERENYLFFLRRLRQHLFGETQTSEVLKTSEVSTSIIAYCLMPNHFHLLVQPHSDQLSRQMQKLSISYTKAVNKRYGRVGPLLQGQFQAVQVDRNDYLLHLTRYIHLNPVEAGKVERSEDWEFSSYRDYIGLRQGTLPTPDAALSQFPDPGAYQEFVESYSSDERKMIEHLLFD
jgi:REP element-mobilizing transposase RayT